MDKKGIPSDWEFVCEFSHPRRWRLLVTCFYRAMCHPQTAIVWIALIELLMVRHYPGRKALLEREGE